MSPFAPYGQTLLRLTFGVVLFAHGWLKLTVFTPAGTVQFFESLGLPGLIAYLTIYGELLGGIALIVGVLTRLVAWLSLPIMLGALWVHIGNGWLFSSPNGGWEFPAVLAMLSVILGLTGSGPLALENTEQWQRLTQKKTAVAS